MNPNSLGLNVLTGSKTSVRCSPDAFILHTVLYTRVH